MPNAGKSSLITRATRARPKVANYPFTTLEPNLGTIDGERRQLILADIPGLIEGASEGKGLGHEFLAHVERCRMLVHVVDLLPFDGTDPVQNHATIEAEIAAYDPRLASLPRVLVLNKADLLTPEAADEAAREWRTRLDGPDASVLEEWEEPPVPDVPIVVTSAATGQGVDALRALLLRTVPERPAFGPDAPDLSDVPLADHKVYRPRVERDWAVERTVDGYRVFGAGIMRLLSRHDLENEEALEYVETRLRKMGVIEALQEQGFEPGDDVEIAGVLFEFDPDA